MCRRKAPRAVPVGPYKPFTCRSPAASTLSERLCRIALAPLRASSREHRDLATSTHPPPASSYAALARARAARWPCCSSRRTRRRRPLLRTPGDRRLVRRRPRRRHVRAPLLRRRDRGAAARRARLLEREGGHPARAPGEAARRARTGGHDRSLSRQTARQPTPQRRPPTTPTSDRPASDRRRDGAEAASATDGDSASSVPLPLLVLAGLALLLIAGGSAGYLVPPLSGPARSRRRPSSAPSPALRPVEYRANFRHSKRLSAFCPTPGLTSPIRSEARRKPTCERRTSPKAGRTRMATAKQTKDAADAHAGRGRERRRRGDGVGHPAAASSRSPAATRSTRSSGSSGTRSSPARTGRPSSSGTSSSRASGRRRRRTSSRRSTSAGGSALRSASAASSR